MLPGAYVHIPAHRKHRVEWTDPNQPTIWLAVHYSQEANKKCEAAG
jgi:cupin 2 domain-containing protein